MQLSSTMHRSNKMHRSSKIPSGTGSLAELAWPLIADRDSLQNRESLQNRGDLQSDGFGGASRFYSIGGIVSKGGIVWRVRRAGQPSLRGSPVPQWKLDPCVFFAQVVAQESNIPRSAFPAKASTPVMSLSQTPVPLRDCRLFDAIQSGSSDWKRQLFDEYLGLVRGLLIKSMGPQAEVDDLVAEVFVGLFESAGNIRSAAGLRSYVVSVTMNTARREFRRRKRFNLFFLRDEGHEIAERTAGVDDPKARAALLQLHRILEGLDHEERLIFVLHVLEELPLQEAAANLSVSLSTAKRRLKRANERIRRRVASNPLLSEFVRERGAALDPAALDAEGDLGSEAGVEPEIGSETAGVGASKEEPSSADGGDRTEDDGRAR